MIERVFIEQGIKNMNLEKYLKSELGRAGFTGMKINKTPLVTRIVLHVARPGLAIGKKGKTIRTLTEDISKKFGIENPQIEIQQIEKPELDAKAMVDKITMLLSRGYSWRSVAFRSIEDIMNAGAQGVELVLKGKLAGKGGRKRKERSAKGYMKKAGGMAELVDYAKGNAYPKAGAIGVRLRIIRPGVIFPDKIKIGDIIKAREEKKEETEKAEMEENKEEKEQENQGEKEGRKTLKGEKKEEKEHKEKEIKTLKSKKGKGKEKSKSNETKGEKETGKKTVKTDEKKRKEKKDKEKPGNKKTGEETAEKAESESGKKEGTPVKGKEALEEKKNSGKKEDTEEK